MKYMRKAVLALVAALVISALPQVAMATDSTDTISITVTVSHVGVSINAATFGFGSLAENATSVQLVSQVTNSGNATETWGLRATGGMGDGVTNWTLATGAGVNAMALYAVFITQAGAAPTGSLFTMDTAGDSVITTNKNSTDDGVFAHFSQPGGQLDGTSVSAGGTRDLYVMLMTPTAAGAAGLQNIYLTAIVSP